MATRSEADAASIQRAQDVVTRVDQGLKIAGGLLSLGEAMPLLGSVCRVCSNILRHLCDVNDRFSETLDLCEKVLEVLRLLDLMARNVAQLQVGKHEVQEKS